MAPFSQGVLQSLSAGFVDFLRTSFESSFGYFHDSTLRMFVDTLAHTGDLTACSSVTFLHKKSNAEELGYRIVELQRYMRHVYSTALAKLLYDTDDPFSSQYLEPISELLFSLLNCIKN